MSLAVSALSLTWDFLVSADLKPYSPTVLCCLSVVLTRMVKEA